MIWIVLIALVAAGAYVATRPAAVTPPPSPMPTLDRAHPTVIAVPTSGREPIGIDPTIGPLRYPSGWLLQYKRAGECVPRWSMPIDTRPGDVLVTVWDRDTLGSTWHLETSTVCQMLFTRHELPPAPDAVHVISYFGNKRVGGRDRVSHAVGDRIDVAERPRGEEWSSWMRSKPWIHRRADMIGGALDMYGTVAETATDLRLPFAIAPHDDFMKMARSLKQSENVGERYVIPATISTFKTIGSLVGVGGIMETVATLAVVTMTRVVESAARGEFGSWRDVLKGLARSVGPVLAQSLIAQIDERTPTMTAGRLRAVFETSSESLKVGVEYARLAGATEEWRAGKIVTWNDQVSRQEVRSQIIAITVYG